MSRNTHQAQIRLALNIYRPSGIAFNMPASSLVDQALVREESAEAAGHFAAAAGHRVIRWELERQVFDEDGSL